jgi:hypothetical protein
MKWHIVLDSWWNEHVNQDYLMSNVSIRVKKEEAFVHFITWKGDALILKSRRK